MSRKNRDVLVSFAFLILLASSILFYLYIRGFALKNLVLENNEEIIEFEKHKIKFNSNISFEKLSLVSDKISDEVINSGGIYFPSLANVLIFYFLVLNMTDLPLKQGETIDIDFTYNLMISKLGKVLFDKFTGTTAYKTLKRQIDKQIQFKKECYIRKISKDKTLENLDKLVQRVTEIIEKQNQLMSSETVEKLEKISKNLNPKNES